MSAKKSNSKTEQSLEDKLWDAAELLRGKDAWLLLYCRRLHGCVTN